MKQRGLYIHIPFCKSKCYYCDFYSVKYDETLVDKYLNSLEHELITLQEKFNILNCQLCTLYIGGGTPSVLSEKQFFSLFQIIYKYFNVSALKEITVEVNPESVTERKISMIKDVLSYMKNANLRISIGVQSFNENILNILGRIHTKDHVYKTVEILNKYGVYNYNFDLIFGCPGQTIQDVEDDIKQTLKLNPNHISCYALSIEPGTTMYNTNFSLDEDLQADMYKKIVETLTEAGYHQYEISNFAIKGYECIHNLNYWFYKEYVGLGPSSVSFLYPLRFKNESTINEYLSLKFRYSVEELDHKKSLTEKVMLALRTSYGVNIDILKETAAKSTVDRLILEHKLILENGNCRIAPEYLFLSNSIIKELI